MTQEPEDDFLVPHVAEMHVVILFAVFYICPLLPARASGIRIRQRLLTLRVNTLG